MNRATLRKPRATYKMIGATFDLGRFKHNLKGHGLRMGVCRPRRIWKKLGIRYKETLKFETTNDLQRMRSSLNVYPSYTFEGNLLKEVAPPAVDSRLLTMIEDGTEELTDGLFFELLKENLSWLSTRPFLVRIAQWQYITDNPIFDEYEQKNARENILRIATALLPSAELGRPRKISPDVLYRKFVQLKSEFAAYCKSHGVPASKRMITLRQAYPQHEEYLRRTSRERQLQSPAEIAIRVLSQRDKVSEKTIRIAIKKCSRSKPRSPSTAKKPE